MEIVTPLRLMCLSYMRNALNWCLKNLPTLVVVSFFDVKELEIVFLNNTSNYTHVACAFLM